jgi:ribosomal protein S18 acetylase RimI-like enzyme
MLFHANCMVTGHASRRERSLVERGVILLSPDGIVEAFLDQWRRTDLPSVMPEPQVVANRGYVELTSMGVYGEYQRRGHGPRALTMLTDLCDANALPIKLVARALENDLLRGCPATLSTDELVAWYNRHGFVETGDAGDDTHEMVREPLTQAMGSK